MLLKHEFVYIRNTRFKRDLPESRLPWLQCTFLILIKWLKIIINTLSKIKKDKIKI